MMPIYWQVIQDCPWFWVQVLGFGITKVVIIQTCGPHCYGIVDGALDILDPLLQGSALVVGLPAVVPVEARMVCPWDVWIGGVHRC